MGKQLLFLMTMRGNPGRTFHIKDEQKGKPGKL